MIIAKGVSNAPSVGRRPRRRRAPAPQPLPLVDPDPHRPRTRKNTSRVFVWIFSPKSCRNPVPAHQPKEFEGSRESLEVFVQSLTGRGHKAKARNPNQSFPRVGGEAAAFYSSPRVGGGRKPARHPQVSRAIPHPGACLRGPAAPKPPAPPEPAVSVPRPSRALELQLQEQRPGPSGIGPWWRI